jgi:hypothetical protein
MFLLEAPSLIPRALRAENGVVPSVPPSFIDSGFHFVGIEWDEIQVYLTSEGFMKVIAVLLFLLPSLCFAGDWDRTDYVLLTAASVGTYIDWRQTQYIARHPDQFRETNRALGDHPTVTQVNVYFARTSVLTGALAYFIPSEYRKMYLGLIAAVEIDATARNRRLGIKFSF